MTEELKPCPFCGEKAQLDFFTKYNGYDDCSPGVDCVMVNCTTPGGCCAGSIEIPYYSKDGLKKAIKEVIEAWNKRPYSQRQEKGG